MPEVISSGLTKSFCRRFARPSSPLGFQDRRGLCEAWEISRSAENQPRPPPGRGLKRIPSTECHKRERPSFDLCFQTTFIDSLSSISGCLAATLNTMATEMRA